jgi:hypothetical protein
MAMPEILDDPLSSQIFFHLLYSGSRTNKQITKDFGMLRVKSKRGVIIRGDSGYNYVRNLTEELADAGVLMRKKVRDEIIYSANLDAKEGIINDLIFDIKGLSGEPIHHSLKFASDQINWFLQNPVTLSVIEYGLGEFNRAFDFEPLESRSRLFDYRMRLERNAKHPKFGLLLFLCKLAEKITDIGYLKVRDKVIKQGSDSVREDVVQDLNSFNWRMLPPEMRKEISAQDIDSYIRRYEGILEKGVIESIISYWYSRTGIRKDKILDFLAFAYIIERLFTLLLYTDVMRSSLDTISEIEFPSGAIKVHVESMELIKSIGLNRAKSALRKINTELTRGKNKFIPEDLDRIIIYSGDIYLPKEFAELVHIQYKQEADEKLKQRNAYLAAIGKKEVKAISLNDALEIVNDKKKQVDVLDVVQLIHAVITAEGTEILEKIKTLKDILEKFYNYEDYFSRLEEMFKMRLPR